MKHATLKNLCLFVSAFSFTKAGAQNFKSPLFDPSVQKPIMLESFQLGKFQLQVEEDSAQAVPLSHQGNSIIYALPLDGTPCLVDTEPADTKINAWKAGNNPDFTVTIP